ncbi:unnamed protein product [Sphenostylis stenocarpa]|uniref:Uncharacterized protein n=1 Tax=Sphenostylis stenocarpa TaxID=92480 RepID=A0AA86TC25_9FABA|nr:unnamed protein product [Sphenostylis stenocarpa]
MPTWFGSHVASCWPLDASSISSHEFRRSFWKVTSLSVCSAKSPNYPDYANMDMCRTKAEQQKDPQILMEYLCIRENIN